MLVKKSPAVPRFNAEMNPVLEAMSRLLDGQPGLPAPAADALAEALSGEPRLRMATRLALVKLAGHCKQPEAPAHHAAHGCSLCAPLIARRLERLARADRADALAGLLELAPALRELAATLRREGSPLAVLPEALLELLRAQLH